jgi:hypothetical protein
LKFGARAGRGRATVPVPAGQESEIAIGRAIFEFIGPAIIARCGRKIFLIKQIARDSIVFLFHKSQIG